MKEIPKILSVRNMIFEVMVREGDMMSTADVKHEIKRWFGRVACYGTVSGRIYELWKEGYLDRWSAEGYPEGCWTPEVGFGERGGMGWTLRKGDGT